MANDELLISFALQIHAVADLVQAARHRDAQGESVYPLLVDDGTHLLHRLSLSSNALSTLTHWRFLTDIFLQHCSYRLRFDRLQFNLPGSSSMNIGTLYLLTLNRC